MCQITLFQIRVWKLIRLSISVKESEHLIDLYHSSRLITSSVYIGMQVDEMHNTLDPNPLAIVHVSTELTIGDPRTLETKKMSKKVLFAIQDQGSSGELSSHLANKSDASKSSLHNFQRDVSGPKLRSKISTHTGLRAINGVIKGKKKLKISYSVSEIDLLSSIAANTGSISTLSSSPK